MGILINKKRIEYNDEVSVKDIKVIRTVDRILANENVERKRLEFFEKDTNSKKSLILSMSVISLVLITINPFIVINKANYFVLALFL